tara:strand:+ start:466 stop:657 length:192 start_codon:yes stop_codon:yes gene_type:complete
MSDRKTYYHSPGEDQFKQDQTGGTPEQGADMSKRQLEQRRKQEEEARERALKIDPDNYTPSRD